MSDDNDARVIRTPNLLRAKIGTKPGPDLDHIVAQAEAALDGLDFVRLVRKGADSPNPYVPIILLTGHTEMHRVLEARDAGVNEILAKPISIKSLFSRIVSIIESPRPFVKSKTYFGPCRRRYQDPNYKGPERRSQSLTTNEVA